MTMAIRTSELATLLDSIPPGVRYLSLDCFDTLVWRNCATPADVFADLTAPGGAIPLRRAAETVARSGRRVADGGTEIALADIHRELRPGGDTAGSIAEEIAAEHRHCFGFRPTMDLIEAAKPRGLQVIIVSDTIEASSTTTTSYGSRRCRSCRNRTEESGRQPSRRCSVDAVQQWMRRTVDAARGGVQGLPGSRTRARGGNFLAPCYVSRGPGRCCGPRPGARGALSAAPPRPAG